MSRNISAKASVTITAEEAAERKTEQGKLIFTRYKGHDCALLLQNDRLKAATFYNNKSSHHNEALHHNEASHHNEATKSGVSTRSDNRNSCKSQAATVGAIYIGKVKNIVKNIDACFVEIAGGELCFLPMKNAYAPYLVNRTYDGRLLEGDELPVQVMKEAQKTKQASVTAQLSLSNNHFVISMGTPKINFSADIDSDTRKKFDSLFTEAAISRDGCLIQDMGRILRTSEELQKYSRMTLPPTGCIVRTKAAETTDAGVLLPSFFDLAAQYVQLLHTALHRSCFSCIRQAPSAIENILRQLAGEEEYQEIVTDSEDIFTELQKITTKPMRLYQDSLLSLSGLYSVDSRLEMALERRVWLKSGGYLIIEPTEAMTVIDVNSGKYEARKSADETYLKINLEAAEEIALQLRLRNLSGIIVVDFINMKAEEDRRALLRHLRELINKDHDALRHRTTVVDMTPLGLVEITRKKINKPLAEQWADCSH